MKVQEYLSPDGSSPYQKWFAQLDAAAASKVTVAVLRMEQGNTSNVKWFEGIGEYKINWGPGYRIYLAMDGQKLIILFGGGTKKLSRPISPKPNSYSTNTRAEREGQEENHEKTH